MKNGNRANALLMELLIVILFFMFAATLSRNRIAEFESFILLKIK